MLHVRNCSSHSHGAYIPDPALSYVHVFSNTSQLRNIEDPIGSDVLYLTSVPIPTHPHQHIGKVLAKSLLCPTRNFVSVFSSVV